MPRGHDSNPASVRLGTTWHCLHVAHNCVSPILLRCTEFDGKLTFYVKPTNDISTAWCALIKRPDLCKEQSMFVSVKSKMQTGDFVFGFKAKIGGPKFAKTAQIFVPTNPGACGLRTHAAWAAFGAVYGALSNGGLTGTMELMWPYVSTFVELLKASGYVLKQRYTTTPTAKNLFDSEGIDWWAKGGRCILGFRPSDTIQDLMQNNMIKDILLKSSKTYYGVPGVLSSMADELDEILKVFRTRNMYKEVKSTCTHLTISGYSLGGGLASLLGVLLNKPEDPLNARLTVDELQLQAPVAAFDTNTPVRNGKSKDGCFAGGIYYNVIDTGLGGQHIDPTAVGFSLIHNRNPWMEEYHMLSREKFWHFKCGDKFTNKDLTARYASYHNGKFDPTNFFGMTGVFMKAHMMPLFTENLGCASAVIDKATKQRGELDHMFTADFGVKTGACSFAQIQFTHELQHQPAKFVSVDIDSSWHTWVRKVNPDAMAQYEKLVEAAKGLFLAGSTTIAKQLSKFFMDSVNSVIAGAGPLIGFITSFADRAGALGYEKNMCEQLPWMKTCTKGQFIDSTGACISCPKNTFMPSDKHRSSKCLAQTVCPAGYRIGFEAGHLVKPWDCLACSKGKFQEKSDHRETDCIMWMECHAPQIEVRPPTITTDRICEAGIRGCTANQFQTSVNPDDGKPLCQDVTQCESGEYRSKNETDYTDAECTAHGCGPGSIILNVDDRAASGSVCQPCTLGTFSDGVQSTACKPQACAPGTYILKPLSTHSRARCAVCADGKYSGQNYTACKPNVCEAGQKLVGKVDRKRAPECTTCPSGHFTDKASSTTECIKHRCPAGSVIANTESLAAATQCSTCGKGTYSVAEEDATCSKHSCPTGQILMNGNENDEVSWCVAKPDVCTPGSVNVRDNGSCEACGVRCPFASWDRIICFMG